jgi:5-methylcytosine-specific restriction endonuclease McrA
MSEYTVVYQFLCPNCNHFGVGKHVFDAEGPAEASHMLSTLTLSCRVCHRSVSTTTTAKTFVSSGRDHEIVEGSMGPAVP